MSTATESAIEAASPTSSTTLRFVAVRANLMPQEVLSARSADRMRQRVVIGLAGLVTLLVIVYLASWFQTHSARDNLASLQSKGVTLQKQTNEFGPLVTAQAQTASIQSQLRLLMVGDLSWRDMLTTLRAKAPSGLTLTQIGGTINAGAASVNGAADTSGGYGALNASGRQQIGTLTLTGTARDKTAVANYVDSLSQVKGLTSPFPTNVTSTADDSVTFNVTVLITADALGGRYATPSAAPSAPVAGTTGSAPATTGGN